MRVKGRAGGGGGREAPQEQNPCFNSITNKFESALAIESIDTANETRKLTLQVLFEILAFSIS